MPMEAVVGLELRAGSTTLFPLPILRAFQCARDAIYERRCSWRLRSERFLKGKDMLHSLFFGGMNALFFSEK